MNAATQEKTDIVFVNREDLKNLLLFIKPHPEVEYDMDPVVMRDRAINIYQANCYYASNVVREWLK